MYFTMSEIEDRKRISDFIQKRKIKSVQTTSIDVDTNVKIHTPWFRRPLGENEFTHKLAKNGRYYVRHKEWSERVWIGPYRDINDVKTIIQSYVVESLKSNLDKKMDSSIHSVIIDNPEEFF